jgi:transposase
VSNYATLHWQTIKKMEKEMEEMRKEIDVLQKTVREKDQKIDERDQEIKTLKNQLQEANEKIAKLQKDSNTSSKPPSSDINKFEKNKSLRKKTERKPGGQKGQKRNGIFQTENPDEIIKCDISHCEKCGKSLEDLIGCVKTKRQERDIPPVKVFVTEYQQIEKKCECGCINTGVFPEHITAPIQIGDNAKSFMIYLNIAHLLPYKRLTTLTEDLFGFSISEGSIENILETAGEKAKSLHKSIMKMIKTGDWVGSDETGMRVEKKTHWLWTWQNKLGSYYCIEKGRGYEVVKNHFGEDYKGILIHDCWSAQNNTTAKKGHQQCHPHIQRPLEFLIKNYRSIWAYQLNKLLLASQKARDQIWKENFDADLRKKIIRQYEQQLETFLQTSLKNKEAITLQKRIRKHKNAILFFLSDPDLPFHNNDSEKSIRQAKVKQKVSGCFRSNSGAERYAILLSVIETSKKHGRNILDTITQLLDGDLWFEYSS